MAENLMKKKTTADNFDADVVGYCLFFSGATYGLKAIVSGIGFPGFESLLSLFVYVGWFIVIARCLISNGQALKNILCFEVLFGSFLFINYVLFPMTRDFYVEHSANLRQIFLVFLPAAGVVSTLKRFDKVMPNIKKYAVAGSLLMIVSFFFGYTKRWGGQFFGVQLAPFCLISLALFLVYGSKTALVLFFVDFVFLLLGGRQSFVVVLLSAFLMILLNPNKQRKNKMVLISLALFLSTASFALVFSRTLSSVLIDLAGGGKAINSMMSGELLDFSNRTRIYDYSVAIIYQNGTKISGAFASRYYVRSIHDWFYYPHNIYLELMLDYGMILGGLLSIFLTMCIFVFFLKKGDGSKKMLGCILIILPFVRLLVSSSYLIEGLFFVSLGLMHGTFFHQRKPDYKRRRTLDVVPV